MCFLKTILFFVHFAHVIWVMNSQRNYGRDKIPGLNIVLSVINFSFIVLRICANLNMETLVLGYWNGSYCT